MTSNHNIAMISYSMATIATESQYGQPPSQSSIEEVQKALHILVVQCGWRHFGYRGNRSKDGQRVWLQYRGSFSLGR